MKHISNKAVIGKNVSIEENVFVGENAILGDNCKIGRNTILDNCIIGENTIIEANCFIGYSNATGWVSRETPREDLQFKPLEIGHNTIIREGTTIYIGAKLGNYVRINHKVLIREKTIIGNNTSIGSMCDLEGNLTIGENCSIHSNCHFCFDTRIGDYVFIAPFCVTTNGNPMSYKRPALYEKFGYEKGPTIGSGCQIAVHVTILPRVIIGTECIIGANSVVTKNTEDRSILVGSPALVRGNVDEMYRLPLEIRREIGIND
jgi:UDP-2-acetamido-3-amino-2,3-dideoxy-glucuronate N-acetyltransferase